MSEYFIWFREFTTKKLFDLKKFVKFIEILEDLKGSRKRI